MSRTTRFAKDRGLTARMTFTIFLLGLVYVLFFGLLIAVGVGALTVVVIAAIFLFVQYFYADKIALFGMRGHLVTEDQEPQLYQIVERLAALADMPMPKIAVSELDIPNAFATGRSPSKAVVCVTRGLQRRLSPQELEAVLSHELSHVAHRDVAVMTIASFIGVLAGLLIRVMFYSELFSGGLGYGGGRGRGGQMQGGGQLVAVEMLIMLVSAIVYAISFLLIRALSRYRELAADRSGAILIGRPALLKSALLRISGAMGQIPTRDLRSAQAFNAFFFTPAIAPRGGIGLGELFSTHPSLEKRIAQLDALERQLGTAE
ncbi:peptidase M48 Ste24p [Acidimicrobium ferrooxidans DSM 10331]|uniref:Protease HtpX homolog n=1 Tax=Acidimicrobium ferrooxidans (strain DSM 10331 / JCM 15462 / NBRC 103882 / ICP) TaxID=525909 RepID=C7LZX0_ACIFD|nr:zinc metalloprotease HtpX [Acidimicrobium ferrooxidans]ACU54278.1 peptidase M48 Ste24p [Acidimicrobium ferrooxidans DSM 10331]